MADLKEMALSNNFADYIFHYSNFQYFDPNPTENYGYQALTPNYFMLHLNNSVFPIENLVEIGYSSVPALFTLTSTVSLEKSGILQTQSAPTLNLNGQGILLGFLDTGINYTHPAFLDDQGKTRILRIWDQTIQSGTPPENFIFGSEYTNQDIDEALSLENPYERVPSRDSNGHGTLMAGIACGKSNAPAAFSGVAPASYIAMVKLKEAKQYLKDYFMINGEAPIYQETDLMLAVTYLNQLALTLNMPLVLCIGLGTNQGSHNGYNPLDFALSFLRSTSGLAIVTAGGNEVGRGHHFSGKVPDESSYQEVEIQVPANSRGYNVELWGMPPETFSVGAVSPLGEVVERIPARLGQNQRIQFVLDQTTMRVSYELISPFAGEQVILIRFQNPTPGIWRIRVYCSNLITGQFHMWLPIHNMLMPDVTFLNPDPFTTITIPGNNSDVITTGTYDAYTDALYVHSSRGFTPLGNVKPDICAPGVNVTGPDLHDGYTSGTGSSMGAAITAGSCALILQWGISRTPRRNFYTNEIKTLFLRGATRDLPLTYPTREWGYGKLNVYNVFTTFLNP